MQNWSLIVHFWKVSNTCRTVGVLLFDAFSNYCLANAVEPLRAANVLARKQLYRWQFLSLDGAVVTSSSGLPVQPERALSRHPGGDFLFLMPSYGFERIATPQCNRALRAASGRFGTVAAMDTGSWLLAAAGLLEGRKATIHWDEYDRFAERFPDTDLLPGRVVSDGKFLSCGGASTAGELVLDLIEAHHGPMLRLEVAALFMQQAPRRAPDDRVPDLPRNVVEEMVWVMRRNIEAPLSVPEVAARLGLTQRALEQHCARRYGVGPRRLYLGIRLREVRRLLENTPLTVEEIATRCGYQNASAMTRAFGHEFGLTPTALRHAG